MKDKPNILVLDIETAPILGYVWQMFENNLSPNQIENDWHILSYSAKWYTDASGETFGPHNKIMYKDQRNAKDVSDDRALLKEVWNLMNEADIILTQNGIAFDTKKLHARFVLNGMRPPSPYRNIDTRVIAKKHFGFTSNKLEYMTAKLNVKYKKQKNSGFEMWQKCLKGDVSAFKEMEKYNRYDVLSLEELYHKLSPWDNSINFNVYSGSLTNKCNCGSTKLQKRGFIFSNTGKFQRFHCQNCGSWTHGKVNLLSKEKRAALKKP